MTSAPRRRAFGLMLALCLLLPAPARASMAERRAVVIGVDRYPPGARWRPLQGAVNDARAVADVLRGPPGYEVTLLTDEAASREAILGAIERHLVDGAGPAREVVLYFSGHGSQVRNSLSTEADLRDETIVPQDGRDIRDFELGALLVRAARAGARVTAIFDSCHSGGVTRDEGAARAADPDEVDHPLAVERPDPAVAGVLTLTAAHGEQRAFETYFDGQHRGRFTAFLLDVLSTGAADLSAEEVVAAVGARLRASGSRQDPHLSGPLGRLRQPLFTAAGDPRPARRMVAAAGVRADGVELAGGPATGLTVGSTLGRRGGGKAPLTLEVRQALGPTRTLGVVRAGEPGSVSVGDLFEVEQAAPARSDRITLEVGPTLPEAEVLAIARAIAPLARSSRLRWIEDPALASTDWLVELGPEGWVARGRDGREERLGGPPTEAALLRLPHSKGAGKGAAALPSFFVRLPAGQTLADRLLRQLQGSLGGPARYALTGRAGAAGPEYAAVLRGAGAGRLGRALACAEEAQLPGRTRWVPGDQLSDLVEDLDRIVRVADWLDRPSSPGEPPFPYHLELRGEGSPGATALRPGAAPAGSKVALWLVSDPARLAFGGAPRWVYVLALDCQGAIRVAVPRGKARKVEGAEPGHEPALAFPPEGAEARARPEHLLGEVRLDASQGSYTFVLLAAAAPLTDVRRLEQEPIRTRTDGAPAPPEDRWWIERVQLQAR